MREHYLAATQRSGGSISPVSKTISSALVLALQSTGTSLAKKYEEQNKFGTTRAGRTSHSCHEGQNSSAAISPRPQLKRQPPAWGAQAPASCHPCFPGTVKPTVLADPTVMPLQAN